MNAPPPFGQFPGSDFPALRFREAGDVTLDLVHRDARVVDRWLALDDGEFALLWQLAEAPGIRVTGCQPAPGEGALRPVPETPGSIAHYAAGLRAKLEPVGLAGLIATHPEGGYTLELPACGPLDSTRWIGQS